MIGKFKYRLLLNIDNMQTQTNIQKQTNHLANQKGLT